MFYVAWSEKYCHPLPEGHRFPMIKYDLLRQQLIYDGTLKDEQFFEPQPMPDDQILLTHDEAYLDALKNVSLSPQAVRRIGFPLSKALTERETAILGGTLQCARYAMNHGVSMNIAGGTHHAYADRGEGFCLLNDIAAAANVLLHEKTVKRILIVDLDVHQGNGTAALFEKEDRVFTFSMHGEKNYPMHKEKSDRDVALPDGCRDDEYMETLRKHLPEVIDLSKPEFIFYLSGVDILSGDKLGRLDVSMQGCAARDREVFETCYRLGIPVAASMGGGYSPRIADIVEAHAQTFRIANDLYF